MTRRHFGLAMVALAALCSFVGGLAAIKIWAETSLFSIILLVTFLSSYTVGLFGHCLLSTAESDCRLSWLEIKGDIGGFFDEMGEFGNGQAILVGVAFLLFAGLEVAGGALWNALLPGTFGIILFSIEAWKVCRTRVRSSAG